MVKNDNGLYFNLKKYFKYMLPGSKKTNNNRNSIIEIN